VRVDRDGPRCGDVDHFIQRGKQGPGGILRGIVAAGGDGPRPDLLLQLCRLRSPLAIASRFADRAFANPADDPGFL